MRLYRPGPGKPSTPTCTVAACGALWRGAVLLLLLTLGGCYSFSGSNLPGHLKTLAIPSIQNETLEPGLESELTGDITARFLNDGRIKLAGSGSADASLDLDLTGYENKVRNYSASEQPVDYIVVLTMRAQFRDLVKNRELWTEEALQATAVWAPDGVDSRSETDARTKAIEQLATDLVARVFEQW